MTWSDFVKEHKRLIGVLKNPTPKALQQEIKEQSDELLEKTNRYKDKS